MTQCKISRFVLFCFVLGLFLSCNQDPIFYRISKEVAPRDPMINGSPSKIVKTNEPDGYDLYTANGKLWKFSGNSWAQIDAPSGNIVDVALFGTKDSPTLYVMTLSGLNTAVYKYSTGAWGGALSNPSGYSIQSIYMDGTEQLFAAGSKTGSDEWAILQLNGVEFKVIQEAASYLQGVAHTGGKYYFATATSGIFTRSGDTGNLSPIPDSSAHTITGIAALNESNIIAVTADFNILKVSSSAITSYSKNERFTGAIALWQKDLTVPASPKLLLLGIRGGVNNYGYQELKITGGNIDWESSLEIPGGRLTPDSSVVDIDKYSAQLEKHVVNHLMQAPSSAGKGNTGLPVVFASTQKNGLWSYRSTGDDPSGVWNAE